MYKNLLKVIHFAMSKYMHKYRNCFFNYPSPQLESWMRARFKIRSFQFNMHIWLSLVLQALWVVNKEHTRFSFSTKFFSSKFRVMTNFFKEPVFFLRFQSKNWQKTFYLEQGCSKVAYGRANTNTNKVFWKKKLNNWTFHRKFERKTFNKIGIDCCCSKCTTTKLIQVVASL